MNVEQQAGDRSYNVSSGGSVTIYSGLSVADTKEIVRDMLREQMSGLQAEARDLIEQRNESLMDRFLAQADARFGEKLEENLGRLRDPGAQYAFRSAQLNYCRYGDDESRDEAISLLVERLSAEKPKSERIVLDQAIEVAPRLTNEQVELLCFYMIAFRFKDVTVKDSGSLKSYLTTIASYSKGLSTTSSGLSMMASLGVIAQHPATKHWLALDTVITNHYWALLIEGASSHEDYGVALGKSFKQAVFAAGPSDVSPVLPSWMQKESWKSHLLASHVSANEADDIIAKADAMLMSSERLQAYFAASGVEMPLAWTSFGDPERELSNYNPTPVGAAVAYARLQKDGVRPLFGLTDVI